MQRMLFNHIFRFSLKLRELWALLCQKNNPEKRESSIITGLREHSFDNISHCFVYHKGMRIAWTFVSSSACRQDWDHYSAHMQEIKCLDKTTFGNILLQQFFFFLINLCS